jgi:hypothetical protein
MRTDNVLRMDAMDALTQKLGMVDAERFIVSIMREPFDYTKWRQDLFADVPLHQFLHDATEYRKQMERQ